MIYKPCRSLNRRTTKTPESGVSLTKENPSQVLEHYSVKPSLTALVSRQVAGTYFSGILRV